MFRGFDSRRLHFWLSQPFPAFRWERLLWAVTEAPRIRSALPVSDAPEQPSMACSSGAGATRLLDCVGGSRRSPNMEPRGSAAWPALRRARCACVVERRGLAARDHG